MYHLNGCHTSSPSVTNGYKEFDEHLVQKFTLYGSKNELENNRQKLRNLLSCKKKFDTLPNYLLEVSKTLNQRQSFYALDFADVLCKVEKWRKMLPNIELFYAVKANDDPLLLKLMVLLGTSFDCASEGEIRKVLEAGAAPESILWAHTIKPVDELQYAKSVGVNAMTFDSENELRKIHKIYPDARLLLRIRPPIVKSIKHDMTEKFGCSTSEAMRLLGLAKQLEMNVFGLCFHVGGVCSNSDCFASAIRECRGIFDEARRTLGYRLSVLDIGGGFLGSSGSEKIFSEATEAIKRALVENFQGEEVRVIAEPGCYVMGSAEKLVCTVIGKRRLEEAGAVKNHYFLNNGIYTSFFAKIEAYDIRMEPLLPKCELETRMKYDSVLFGQTCCPEDVIRRNQYLPDLEVGERVVWENMGAYSGTVCTAFNTMPQPVKVYFFQDDEGLLSSEIYMQKGVKDFLQNHAVCIGKRESTSG